MTLDSVLNFLVPTLLILIGVGFVWIRTPVGAWLGPHIREFFNWIRGESETTTHEPQTRSIVYE